MEECDEPLQENNNSMELKMIGGVKTKKYIKYEEFLERRDLAELFDLTNAAQIIFIKDRLLRLRPRAEADVDGWVYVYYR